MARFDTPESILLRKGSPEELKESEEALYKLIVPENEKRAINIDKFADLYDVSAIEADKAYVQNTLERIEQEEQGDEVKRAGKMRGRLFEAIVNSQIAESDWMGSKAETIVPSRYDDLKNKIDSIIEFGSEKGGNAHLALAIDVTESDKQMREKFAQIKQSIENSTLSTVKYFKSKNLRAELSNVPRVVVGAGRETVGTIVESLLRFKRLQKTIAESRKKLVGAGTSSGTMAEFTKVRSEVARHPMQAIIITEIRKQLATFMDYAHRTGRDEVAEHYAPVLALIDSIAKEKGELAKVDKDSAQDSIYRMIVERTERFGEELDRPN